MVVGIEELELVDVDSVEAIDIITGRTVFRERNKDGRLLIVGQYSLERVVNIINASKDIVKAVNTDGGVRYSLLFGHIRVYVYV